MAGTGYHLSSLVSPPPVHIMGREITKSCKFSCDDPLNHHNQSPRPDQHTADQRLYCKWFMKNQKSQYKGKHDAQLIHRHDSGRVSQLQGPVITEPGCAGGQPGENQEDPAFSADPGDPALGIG